VLEPVLEKASSIINLAVEEEEPIEVIHRQVLNEQTRKI
jgi:hypothetical protein